MAFKMKQFRLQSDCVILAEDIDDAFGILATHFYNLMTDDYNDYNTSPIISGGMRLELLKNEDTE